MATTSTSSRVRRAPRRQRGEVVIAMVQDQRITAARVRRTSSRLTVSRIEEAGGVRSPSGSCIVLLSRQEYLIRTVEVPRAADQDLVAMLRLEAEATLPGDFGEAEIGYRPLEGGRPGYGRFEVYVVRSVDLERKLKPLRDAGVEVSAILPSAVIWDALLADGDDAHLYVSSWGQGRFEVAALDAGSALSIRMIDHGGTEENLLHGPLADSIRAKLANNKDRSGPLVVEWIGAGLPRSPINDQVEFRAMSRPGASLTNGEWKQFDEEPLLYAAALVLLGTCGREVAGTANLLPAAVMDIRRRKAAARRCLLTAAMAVIALALFYAALQIQIVRYETVRNEQTNLITMVKREGEQVGRRMEELSAIRGVRASRHEFYDLLRGLHDATPDEVSYSQVLLGEDGRVTLRGQAASLSLPFILPEKLEAQPMFRNVLLTDAGQARKGGGTVTEFRIDCEMRTRKRASP